MTQSPSPGSLREKPKIKPTPYVSSRAQELGEQPLSAAWPLESLWSFSLSVNPKAAWRLLGWGLGPDCVGKPAVLTPSTESREAAFSHSERQEHA